MLKIAKKTNPDKSAHMLIYRDNFIVHMISCRSFHILNLENS